MDINKLLLILLILQFGRSQIEIIYPLDKAIIPNNSTEFALANFGVVPFGNHIKGKIVLSEPFDACEMHPITLASNATLDYIQPYDNQIVIAERGNCHFTTKALNAQTAGAQALIVFDNVDEYTYNIIMADDGAGSSVNIPLVLIEHSIGQTIVDYLNENKKKNILKARIKFPSQQTDIVNLHFGLQVCNLQTYDFLSSFVPYYRKIEKKDIFYDMYVSTETDENCLGNGKYCVAGIDSVPGRYCVFEILRQTCILKLYPQNWWLYMENIPLEIDHFKNITQFQELLRQTAGLPSNDNSINNCINESFNITSNFEFSDENIKLPNKMLDDQIQLTQNAGFTYFPGIIINNITYKGTLTPKRVFNDICDSLNEPVETCVQRKYVPPNLNYSTYKDGLVMVIVVLLILGVFFFLLFFFYRKWARKRILESMQPQVQGMVSSYIQLSEKKKADQSASQTN